MDRSVAVVIESLERRQLLSTVTLDPTFGTSGQSLTDLALPTQDTGTAAVTLPNHDIVVAGYSQSASSAFSSGMNNAFLIAYNESGAIDTSFGTAGIAQFPSPSKAYSLQIQTINGQPKLLVGISCQPAPLQPDQAAVLRYNTDGTLDTSFGNAGVAISALSPTPDNGSGSPSRVALAVQSTGAIVEAGMTHGTTDDMAVTRFTANGLIDTGFGTGGITSIDFSGNQDYVTCIGVDSNDRIVVGGYGSPSNSNNSDFEAARLTSTGALDTSFGAGGKVHTDIAGMGLYDAATAMLINSDNTIILGGFAVVTTVPSTQRDFALVEYDTSGNLNAGFGSGGIVTTDIEGQGPGDFSSLSGLAFEGTKIVAAGTQFGGGGAVRYNPDGSLDTTFNGTGEYGYNQPNYVSTIDDRIVQPVATADGGVALVGTVFNTNSPFDSMSVGSWDVIIQKFTSGGAIDTSFGTSGEAITALTGPSRDLGQSVSVTLPDNKIIVASQADGWNRNSFLARYNANGTLDTTFGNGGIAPILASTAGGEGAVSADDMVFALQTQTVGSQTYLLVGGVFNTDGSDNRVGIMRFNMNGTLDTSFGTGGFATNPNILPYPGGNLVGEGLALQNGRILETGETNHGTNDMAVARFNADGSVDTSFGSAGVASVDFGGNQDFATCVGVDSTGQIVLGGYTYSNANTNNWDFAVARLNANNGSLDTSFGTGGMTTTDFAGGADWPRAMLIDANNNIVLGGTAHINSDDFALVRYTASGTLDSSFGTSGKVTTDLGADEYLMGLTFEGSQIVGVGQKRQPGGVATSGVVVSYNSDGSLDTNFNDNGQFVLAQRNFNYSFNSAAIAGNSGLIVVGSDYNSSTDVQSMLLARLVVPYSLVVNTLADQPTPGKLTLRQAIALANTDPGPDTITFAPGLTGTIVLTQGELDIADVSGQTTILGPGADVIAVSGGGNSRIFAINDGVIAISGLKIAGGQSDDGGGILNGGTLSLSDCAFTGNSASTGGAIDNPPTGGDLTVTNCTFSGDSAADGGGAIANGGTLVVTGCTFSGNSSSFSGGAIENTESLTVSGSTFSNNSAVVLGGAIDDAGVTPTDVTDTTFSGNTAINGGAIDHESSTLLLSNCTFSRNSATGDPRTNTGGAISNFDALVATNSTFFGNSAVLGGGIYNSGNPSLAGKGALTLTNCTINENTATSAGAGIYDILGGTVTLNNSIVAGNVLAGGATPSDVLSNGGIIAGSYNLIGTGGAGGLSNGINGNMVGVTNPGLAALNDNRGPTQTIALLPGSPAIDKGSNFLAVDAEGLPLATDQRGLPRIVNGVVDIGAYELQTTVGEQLAFYVEPASTSVGSALDAPGGVKVAVEDLDGKIVTSDSSVVTLTLNGGTFTGGNAQVSAAAVNGVATFTSLVITGAGSYTLTATDAELVPATSTAFNVTAAPIFVVANASGIYGGTTTLTAALGAPLANETINFSIRGTPVGTATTDASGTATLGGVSLAGLNVGTYIVTASFPGDTGYAPASGSAALAIAPARLTITVNNANTLEGATLPPLTVSYSGFVNGDTPASLHGTLTITTTATANSSPGTYPITATGLSSTNYHTTYIRGTLTVTASNIVPLVVNSLLDPSDPAPGRLTLRQAIALANNHPGPDTISFLPGLTGTIQLSTAFGELYLDDQTTIQGPGASLLTISGGPNTGRFPGSYSGVMRVEAAVNLSGLSIINGQVGGYFGGGIYNDTSGRLTVTDCTFTNDTTNAYGEGGGIYNNKGMVTVSNCTFSNDSAGFGGGIRNDDGQVAVYNTAFIGDGATSQFGGAIDTYEGTVGCDLCTFSYNHATFGGGGIHSNGTNLTVQDSTFSGNIGGGIVSTYGALYVGGSTFVGNETAADGGGICTISDNFSSIVNCTFTGNSASGVGGGIYVVGVLSSLLPVDIANNTIAGNRSNLGGGLAVNIGYQSPTLNNNIIAGNTTTNGNTPNDIWAQFPNPPGTGYPVQGKYNLIGTESGSANIIGGVNGNIVGATDPKLGPLADNGGPTQTMALLSGSPAIDAGSNDFAVDWHGNPLAADQRGLTRIVNGVIDIGACEFQAPVPVNPASISTQLQSDVAALQNSGNPSVSFSATTNAQITAFLTAVSNLQVNPGGPTVSISLDASQNTFTDQTVTVPPNVVLTINGATFVGGSPALIVTSGNVIVTNSVFSNSTNAPTILVEGGSLKLRGDTVNESTGYSQAAIEIDGGSVDLGSASDPGNNVLNVDGAGVLIRSGPGGPTIVPDTSAGNTFEMNGQIASPDCSLQGMVWVDFNDDGNVDFGEQGIGGIPITIAGTDLLGNQVQVSLATDADGLYSLSSLWPGTYSITEGPVPSTYIAGKDAVGTLGGSNPSHSLFSNIPIGTDQTGFAYNFGQPPAPGAAVSKGQAAGIGFWANKNGQALIASFSQIGAWLAATMPNTFGVGAGPNNLAGETPAQVAAVYLNTFVLKDKLDAQVMATALNVFATDRTLGGLAASYYGFTAGQYGLGDSTWNLGSDGAAFNVSNNSTLTVMQILQDWDQQLNKSNASLRKLALDVFGGINSKGGL